MGRLAIGASVLFVALGLSLSAQAMKGDYSRGHGPDRVAVRTCPPGQKLDLRSDACRPAEGAHRPKACRCRGNSHDGPLNGLCVVACTCPGNC